MKRKTIVRIVGVCAVVVVIGVAGKFGYSYLKGKKDATNKNLTVKQSSISLTKMDLVSSVSATGTVESKNTKAVSASVNGVSVKSVKVKVGDTVKKGDVIATFDLSDNADNLSKAQSDLSDARTDASDSISDANEQLSQARSSYQKQKTKLDKKVSEAKSTYDSAKTTVSNLKKKISSEKDIQKKAELQQQLTKAQEAVTQAKSAYEQAVDARDTGLEQSESSITNAQKSVKEATRNGNKSISEAEDKVEDAQKTLEDGSVTAPIGGVVTAVNVSEGDSYSGGTVCQIDDTSAYTVTTSVDEYDISKVAVGQKVVIKTDATGDKELKGKVTFIAPSLTSSSTTTSSGSNGSAGGNVSSGSDDSGYEVKVKITSKNKKLRLGLTAKCSIVLEEASDVYAVPYDAVHKGSDGNSYITVIDTSGSSDNSMGNPPEKPAMDSENTTQFQDGNRSFDNSSDTAQSNTGSQGMNQGGDVTTSASKQSTKEIKVTVGMKSDYYEQIISTDLKEGMKVVIPTSKTSDSSSSSDNDKSSAFGMPGGNGSGMGGPGGNGSNFRGSGQRGGAPGGN